MKLGLAIDWAGARMRVPVERVRLAEELGFDSVWSAEAYGSDAITPLAYLAGFTRRIRLGTGIMQLAARAPACAAMTANTLESLAGEGRVIVGLGVSGPQIVEGWYGQPWGRPSHRLRDYVAIMRKVLKREAPVSHEGEELQLPYRGPGASGLGKPLKSILHTHPDIPIWLGTGSRTMVTLTAEIADGWLPFGFVPGSMDIYRDWLDEGFRRAGPAKDRARFEIQGGVYVNVTSDVRGGIDAMKPMIALYVGGMGHKDRNFHKEMMARRGHPEAAEKIQSLFLQGRREEAIAAVPDDYVDDGALIGPRERIRGKLYAWRDSGATGLTLHNADEAAMRMIADIVVTTRES